MRPREHYDLALVELLAQLRGLGDQAFQALNRAMDALQREEFFLAQEVVDDDRRINQLYQDLRIESIHLIATQQPVAGDLRRIIAVVEMAGEFERIADYAKGIATLTLGEEARPPLVATHALIELAEHVQQMFERTLIALSDMDDEAALALTELEEQVDACYRRFKADMAKQILHDPVVAIYMADLLFVAHNLERTGDRLMNIAERIAYAIEGELFELNA
jgi:phosphate transport system protein